MRLRILLLPIALLVIVVVCEYRLSRVDPRSPLPSANADMPMRAPAIEALDSSGRFFRVDRYVGRQSFFVVFFDREIGFDGDPNLQLLVAHERELQKHNIVVIAVSSALPQENRTATGGKHMVLVTDVEPIWVAHRRWGRFDETAEKPTSGVFFVDRSGNVPSRAGLPTPMTNPQKEILNILAVK
jgi:hypothetical protein